MTQGSDNYSHFRRNQYIERLILLHQVTPPWRFEHLRKLDVYTFEDVYIFGEVIEYKTMPKSRFVELLRRGWFTGGDRPWPRKLKYWRDEMADHKTQHPDFNDIILDYGFLDFE